jgi:hypothetical protein
MWKFPMSVWELMQGLSDDTWYAPVLNRVRKIPSRQIMQFHIYFYKFNIGTDGSVLTSISQVAESRELYFLIQYLCI